MWDVPWHLWVFLDVSKERYRLRIPDFKRHGPCNVEGEGGRFLRNLWNNLPNGTGLDILKEGKICCHCREY